MSRRRRIILDNKYSSFYGFGVHWLTWHEIGQIVRSWQGIIATSLAAIGAIYYGPRKVLETWDWYWDRFRDGKVLLVLHRRKFEPTGGQSQSNFGQPAPPKELPYGIQELADLLGQKKKSVIGSVKRLWRRGKIEPYQNGWRIKG